MTQLSPAQPAAPSSNVRDVTAQNFMQEVVQASLTTPVLVYFTAAWCGPCKQYGPLLEKVVNESKGAVKLARVDIDKNPQLAQQFRIQSVPMVYVFYQGQPLDAFAGAVPESQLKQMIAQFQGAAPEAELTKATLEEAKKLLEEGNIEDAELAFKEILTHEEENIDALAGLARCFIAQGNLEMAEQLLAQVAQDKQSNEAYAAAKAALALAKSAPKTADEKALRAKLAASALDHAARYELATALFAGGKQEEAISELIAIIAKDRNWNEGAARTQLLTFFEALGRTHPLASAGRRKLSAILFS